MGPISIQLRGGSIDATGGENGAGIGGGGDHCDTIDIWGWGSINAVGGHDAAAIGAGKKSHSGTINIQGDSSKYSGSANANNASYPLSIKCTITPVDDDEYTHGAVIGSGDGTAGDISISYADLDLNSGNTRFMQAAFIGTGSQGDGIHMDGIDTITVSHSHVQINYFYGANGAGIGAGDKSKVNHIVLDDVNYDGPTIGSSTYVGMVTRNGDVKSISINASRIIARPFGFRQQEESSRIEEGWFPKAGIGTSAYGSVDSIEITNCAYIEAVGTWGAAAIGSGGMIYTGGDNPEEWSPSMREAWNLKGKVGAISIEGCEEVHAESAFGGAAIGSGVFTSVKEGITIVDSNVEANASKSNGEGYGGTGIGGGAQCGCGYITITGSEINASGGNFSAGIGASGFNENNAAEDWIMGAWNESLGTVTIAGSEITANGGYMAAGIGTGAGVPLDDDIIIEDSIVKAYGGEKGAGIGSGPENSFDAGGDANAINIMGSSNIYAKGGRGAAGIGGGFSGSLQECTIDVDMSIGSDGKPIYQVWAEGGDGAAGIGAGSMTGKLLCHAKDADDITIKSGFVYARGGEEYDTTCDDNSEYYPAAHIGAGAGIGGGDGAGVGNVTIEGGVVVAHAGIAYGYNHLAEDIGTGGDNYSVSTTLSKSHVTITGGTVVAGLTKDSTVTIDGGSVQYQVGGNDASADRQAKRCDDTRVFRCQGAIPTSQLGNPIDFGNCNFYLVSASNVTPSPYGTNDIYALESGDKAYFYSYMPQGDAAITVTYDDKSRKYTSDPASGVTESNANWIKQESAIELSPASDEVPYAGQTDFKLTVTALPGASFDNGTGTATITEGSTVASIADGNFTLPSDDSIAIDEADLKLQTALLAKAIDDMSLMGDSLPSPLTEATEPLTSGQAIEEAASILEQLHADIMQGNNGEGGLWAARYGETHKSPMNESLSTGYAGAGVFAAACLAADAGVANNAKRVLDISLHELDCIARRISADSGLVRKADVGLSDGLSGILRSLQLMWKYTQDPRIPKIYRSLLDFVETYDFANAQGCNIYNGLGGLLLTLSRKTTGLPTCRRVREIADELLSRGVVDESGHRVWNERDGSCGAIGYGKGSGGIGLAFLYAWQTTGEARYWDACCDAVAYESEAYSEDLGFWPLKTIARGKNACAPGICRGISGQAILFARTAQLDVPTASLSAERARSRIGSLEPDITDNLCCGTSSIVEGLLSLDLRREAGLLLRSQTERKQNVGFYIHENSKRIPYFNPSLFFGCLGVGYELLRYAGPNVVDSLFS